MYTSFMISLIVDEKYDGKKLDRFLLDKFNNLNFNEFRKALRKKDIKVNGKRINQNISLSFNDNILVYICDDILYGKKQEIEVVFEDDNILVVNKPSGINVQKENANEFCLMDLVDNYFIQKNEKILAKPCHRLDRNTSGLIIIAKNNEAEKILLEKFKNREIKKYYLATVYGIPKVKQATLNSYLFKDSKKKQVYISDTKKTGYVQIITKYKVVKENKQENISVLEVELITRQNPPNTCTPCTHWFSYNWRW